MKTITKKQDNVYECECGTVIEYESDDLSLSSVKGTEYYSIGVKCPVCGKMHAVKPVTGLNDKTLVNEIKRFIGANNSVQDDLHLDDCVKLEKYAYAHTNEVPCGAILAIGLKNGYRAEFELIGKNHDMQEDGSYAAWTFCLKDLYGTDENGGHVMNSKCTNGGGWDKSEMRQWLNGEFFNLLPDEFQKIIKPVVKPTASGSSKNAKIVESVDKIFIPSEVEVYGKAINSKEGEGEQYEFFKEWHNRIKGYTDGEYGRCWFTRSPYSGNRYDFCGVGSSGDYYSNYAYSTYGVSPCFAI